MEVVDRGVDLAAYPNAGTPKAGPLPHLVKYALAAGAASVRVVRRSVSGQNIHACRDELQDILADLVAKGWTPDYWLLWQGEAETLDPAASPAEDYQDNLEHYCRLVLQQYPDCRIVLPTLLMRTDDYGGAGASAAWPTILAAQLAVAAAYPGRVLTFDTQVPAVLDMADSVHASPDDDGGYDVAMQRFRDLWSQ